MLHDLHESVPYLYDNTVGDGPYNAWLDPLLTNEWQMIGWNNVQEMTRLGMPGVFAHGNFDTWSPGYLMFMAATHNGISRLYETFGNGGTAETVERTLSPSETSRTWYRQNPPLPRVKWSLRNNNNYEQTGLLVSLSYFANNRAAVPPELLREEQALDPQGDARKGRPRTCCPATIRVPARRPSCCGSCRSSTSRSRARRRRSRCSSRCRGRAPSPVRLLRRRPREGRADSTRPTTSRARPTARGRAKWRSLRVHRRR